MPDTTATTAATTVTVSAEVAAPAERVWELVSDLPGMGRFSPEATGGRWVSGGGPVVGAVFAGSNAQGSRRWSTRAKVVRSEPGRAFAFDVSSFGLPVARWAYELQPAGPDGCTVSETWLDRRGTLVRLGGRFLTGVGDRASYAAESMRTTLDRVREVAEQEPPAS